MKSGYIRSLVRQLSVLALGLCLLPQHAAALTSDGSDGVFHPFASVVLGVGDALFNFTDIFIPDGVMVSFSELAVGQPIHLLATGSIDIAGSIDAGSNALWIETPGTFTLTGSISGGSLTLYAGTLIAGGPATGPDRGPLGSGGTISLGGGRPSGTTGGSGSSGGDITIHAVPSPVPEPESFALMLAGLGVIGFRVRRLRAIAAA